MIRKSLLFISLFVLLLSTPPIRRVTFAATIPPTNTKRPTATPTNTATTTETPFARPTFIATPIPNDGFNPTATLPPPTPGSYTEFFVFGRPIPPDGVNYLARNYAFGSRDGGGRPTHHGADFQNPMGTSILAAAAGIVEYAGDDVRVLFGPQPNFYGNVIVIRHNIVDADQRPVFTLYGHLSRINVATGQAVRASEVIGLVGSAGVAVGAHLHFEVRIGEPNDYTAVHNPELWMVPFSGTGVIAGRVMDTYGNSLPGVVVTMQGPSQREAETYWDRGVQSDTRLGENFAVGDVPAGTYQVFVRSVDGALKYRNTVVVRPQRVTMVEMYIAP